MPPLEPFRTSANTLDTILASQSFSYAAYVSKNLPLVTAIKWTCSKRAHLTLSLIV